MPKIGIARDAMRQARVVHRFVQLANCLADGRHSGDDDRAAQRTKGGLRFQIVKHGARCVRATRAAPLAITGQRQGVFLVDQQAELHPVGARDVRGRLLCPEVRRVCLVEPKPAPPPEIGQPAPFEMR